MDPLDALARMVQPAHDALQVRALSNPDKTPVAPVAGSSRSPARGGELWARRFSPRDEMAYARPMIVKAPLPFTVLAIAPAVLPPHGR